MKVAGREHDAFEKLPVLENLLAGMKREGIAVSAVLHVASRPDTQTDVNRFASESRRTNLIPFGAFHPDCMHPMEELERLKDKEMAGVKFHPPFQRVCLDDARYTEIWKRINKLGFAVLIHCGQARTPRPFDLYPSGVAKIIRFLPDVPVILAHMGGRSGDEREEKILYSLPKNVYIDTAMSAVFQDPADFYRIAAGFGPERVLFGSDFPYGDQRAAIDYIVNSPFSEHEKAMMLGETAYRLIGKNIRTR